jgi:hypothetical protein
MVPESPKSNHEIVVTPVSEQETPSMSQQLATEGAEPPSWAQALNTITQSDALSARATLTSVINVNDLKSILEFLEFFFKKKKLKIFFLFCFVLFLKKMKEEEED